MKCEKCGTAVEANEKFCSGCGATAPAVPSPVQSATFCQECGCKLEPEEKFCAECGATVGVVEPAVSVRDKPKVAPPPPVQPLPAKPAVTEAPVVAPAPKPAPERSAPTTAPQHPPAGGAQVAPKAVAQPQSPPTAPQPAQPPIHPVRTAATPPITQKTSTQPLPAASQKAVEQPTSSIGRKVIYGLLGVVVAGVVGIVAIGASSKSKTPVSTSGTTDQPAVSQAASPAPVAVVPPTAIVSTAPASSPSTTNAPELPAVAQGAAPKAEPAPQPAVTPVVDAKPSQPQGKPVQRMVNAAIQGNKAEFLTLLQEAQKLQDHGSVNTPDRRQARKLNDDALKAMKEQNYPTAVELLQKASTLDPHDIEIGDNLGFALRLAGKYQESEAQIISVIERGPTREQAWFNLGETNSKLGKSAQAVALFVTAHSLAPNPKRTLETYTKLSEKAEDEQFRANLKSAIQKINASN